MCKNGECEDEFHFIMTCEYYGNSRELLFNTVKVMYPNFDKLSKEDKFVWLMASADQQIINTFTAYIYAAFQLRQKAS